MSLEVIPIEVIKAVRKFIVDKKCGSIVVHFQHGRIRQINTDELVRIK